MEIFIVAVVVILIFMVLLVTGDKKDSRVRDKLRKDFNEILKLKDGNDSERRDCIVRLDAILGQSLKYAGFKGQTVGERLKDSGKFFQRKNYDGIWKAHKLRNRLVHEQVEMSAVEFRDAIKYFKLAVNKLLK